MPKENQSDGRAHDCDHEQIFCAHGHIHAHRKSRVIGVLMAMCTSKPIIGKRAPRAPLLAPSAKVRGIVITVTDWSKVVAAITTITAVRHICRGYNLFLAGFAIKGKNQFPSCLCLSIFPCTCTMPVLFHNCNSS